MRSRSMLQLGLMVVVLAGLPGCFSFGGGSDSGTTASKSASETTVYREVAELVKLYRICLQKNEENPIKAKENCGVYKDAIRDLAPDNLRTTMGEVLDRLRGDKPPKPADKSQKPSKPRDTEAQDGPI